MRRLRSHYQAKGDTSLRWQPTVTAAAITNGSHSYGNGVIRVGFNFLTSNVLLCGGLPPRSI